MFCILLQPKTELHLFTASHVQIALLLLSAGSKIIVRFVYFLAGVTPAMSVSSIRQLFSPGRNARRTNDLIKSKLITFKCLLHTHKVRHHFHRYWATCFATSSFASATRERRVRVSACAFYFIFCEGEMACNTLSCDCANQVSSPSTSSVCTIPGFPSYRVTPCALMSIRRVAALTT